MEIAVLTRSAIADRTTPDGRRLRREKLAEDIPVAVTQRRIRRKWLEMLGDLFAPGRRHPLHMRYEHAAAIVAAWRPLWRDLWLAVERGQSTVEQAWSELVADGTIHTDLPVIQGIMPTPETFPWGPGERRLYGLAYVPEPPQLDADRLARQATALTERTLADGTLVTRASHRLDSAALGLPPSEMAIITDPSIERPIDYTMPIGDALIVPRV